MGRQGPGTETAGVLTILAGLGLFVGIIILIGIGLDQLLLITVWDGKSEFPSVWDKPSKRK